MGEKNGRLRRKEYEKELAKLHGELVKLQEKSLNVIHHMLSRIPYKDVTPNGECPKLPDRQKRDGYVEPDYPYKYVPERY